MKIIWQHRETFIICQILKAGWQNHTWTTTIATYLVYAQCWSLKTNTEKQAELTCEGGGDQEEYFFRIPISNSIVILWSTQWLNKMLYRTLKSTQDITFRALKLEERRGLWCNFSSNRSLPEHGFSKMNMASYWHANLILQFWGGLPGGANAARPWTSNSLKKRELKASMWPISAISPADCLLLTTALTLDCATLTVQTAPGTERPRRDSWAPFAPVWGQAVVGSSCTAVPKGVRKADFDWKQAIIKFPSVPCSSHSLAFNMTPITSGSFWPNFKEFLIWNGPLRSFSSVALLGPELGTVRLSPWWKEFANEWVNNIQKAMQ